MLTLSRQSCLIFYPNNTGVGLLLDDVSLPNTIACLGYCNFFKLQLTFDRFTNLIYCRVNF